VQHFCTGPIRYWIMEHDELKACDILTELRELHPGRLPDDVIRVRVVQSGAAVWLERTSRTGRPLPGVEPPAGLTTVVERDPLSGFIACGPDGELLFDPATSVLENAREFLRLTPYTLINVTCLFADRVAREVDEGYREGGAAAVDCWDILAGALEAIAPELEEADGEGEEEQVLAQALVALATLLRAGTDDSVDGEIDDLVCGFDEECLFPTPTRVQGYFRDAVARLLESSRTFPGLFDEPAIERVMELYDGLDFGELEAWPARHQGEDAWLMRRPSG
jgi:hypothetical protein